MEQPNIIFTTFYPKHLQENYTYLFFFRETGSRLRLFGDEPSQEALSLLPGDILLISGKMSSLAEQFQNSSNFSGNSASSTVKTAQNRLCLACRSDYLNESVGSLLLEQNPISRFLVQTTHVGAYEDYLIIRAGDDSRISSLLQAMEQESQQKEPFYDVMLSHLFSLLAAHLIRAHSGHCFRDIDAPFSEEGYRIMEEIIRSDFRLTLKDIARSQHIAPAYASRYVKKTTGVAFSQIMTRARDHIACLMLSTTPKSIHAIAEQVGYEKPANSEPAFKKLHGCTPGEDRKRNEA